MTHSSSHNLRDPHQFGKQPRPGHAFVHGVVAAQQHIGDFKRHPLRALILIANQLVLVGRPDCANGLGPGRHGGLIQMQVRFFGEVVVQRLLANINPVTNNVGEGDPQIAPARAARALPPRWASALGLAGFGRWG